MHDYDLVIVGGGLVGASLACALRETQLRIAIVEKAPADAPQPSYDERVIALSLGSRRIFTGMGVWSLIAPEAEPIREVHVCERGGCGFAHLSAADEGVPALGDVAPARAIGAALNQRLANSPNTEWLRPARVLGLRVTDARACLEVALPDGHRNLTAALVVAADGGDSDLRERVGIPIQESDYGQQAIISTVTPQGDPARPLTRGLAFERFTDSGPLALLPMTQGRYSVVWSAREQDSQAILSLDDSEFLAQLQQRFGYRLGRLTQPSRRIAYPLRLRLAKRLIGARVALLGNAAHTLHPVAGQGFNLGLRDVAELTDQLVDAGNTASDLGSTALLNAYQARRRPDHLAIARLTDGLVRLFGLPCPGARVGRNLALIGLDLLPMPRHRLARRLMGIDGRQPRLARGLPPVSQALRHWTHGRKQSPT